MAHNTAFLFCWADGFCDLGVMEGCELTVGIGRVEYAHVELLRPVLVDLERLLCVGGLVVGM